ncbi:hypothetical protein J8273_8239 [Carpediemonas membranifera]|uniref:Uncharacterized protein n=1 Tax=Carpediemonas membranifera TaxID=201153 RepID=A0A8J6AY96_9EUKA|nr:hypothetical protein J8273_8239 [Carpediemonas membranifera]|eukprot:KAG9390199.1 hypothetical protein J8273_8239 [Carpediemonas membranifera]
MNSSLSYEHLMEDNTNQFLPPYLPFSAPIEFPLHDEAPDFQLQQPLDLNVHSAGEIPPYRPDQPMPVFDVSDINVEELINSYEYFHMLCAEGKDNVAKRRPPGRRPDSAGHARSLSVGSAPGIPFDPFSSPDSATRSLGTRPRSNSGNGRRQCAAFRRNGGPGIKRGMFCACRECCNPMTNPERKSPYCSSQCQTREQNLRQSRVKPNRDQIKAKRCMLDGLLALFKIQKTQILPERTPSPSDLASPATNYAEIPRPPMPVNLGSGIGGPGDSVCRPMSLQSLLNDDGLMGLGGSQVADEYRMLQGGGRNQA